MLKWTTGCKKPIRHGLCDVIIEEGVHVHANRVVAHVRERIADRLAALRMEVALNEPLDADMLDAMRADELDRARRAYGLL
jgi:hypothetical protein